MGDIVATCLSHFCCCYRIPQAEWLPVTQSAEAQSWKHDAGRWYSQSGKGCFPVHRGSFNVMCPAMRVLS